MKENGEAIFYQYALDILDYVINAGDLSVKERIDWARKAIDYGGRVVCGGEKGWEGNFDLNIHGIEFLLTIKKAKEFLEKNPKFY